jgi:DHA2 family multidrug resistance protein
MGAIDSSIVNVAIPHLRGELSATVEEVTWITTAFVIATVLVMPLTAFLGRLFGQKRIYMLALTLFLFGSALCGLARSLGLMIMARVVQGLGAGALQPTEQAILRQTFPPEEQGMASAVFGMAVVIGPAFGPTLGGWIIDNYSWPWIFYINLPVGAVALVMVSRFVHEPEDVRAANQEMAAKQRRNIDWLGIALLSICLASLQYVLEEGTSDDWFESRVITACTVTAVVACLAFIWRELTAPAPVVDLTLFRNDVFTSGTLIGSVMFAMLMAQTFLLPLFMQEMLGFTAMQSGLALMPRSLAMMVTMPIVGRLYNRVSPRIFIAFGILLFAVTAYQMSHYTLNTSTRDVVSVLLLQGAAFASLFIPLTTVALSRIPRFKMADATGLNSLLRQIGGSVGLAIFASLITRFATQARYGLMAHLNPGRADVIQRFSQFKGMLLSRGFSAAAAEEGANRLLTGLVAQQSMVLSFEKLFLLAGIAFICVLPLTLFLRALPPAAPGEKREVAEVHVEV